jgi:hypothetical protein
VAEPYSTFNCRKGTDGTADIEAQLPGTTLGSESNPSTKPRARWLNQVERVFADLTHKQLRRGVFTSVAALKKAAIAYLDARNDDARPFAWTADANTILGRVAKHRAAISRSGH